MLETAKIISRRKLNGLGRHYGVMLPDGRCFDLQPWGVRELNFEEFSSGLEVRIEQEAPFCNQELVKRLEILAQKNIRYGIIKFNCESFARFLATGKAESKQIKYLAASTFAAGLCYYFLLAPLGVSFL